jgi:1-acyl-sn-glycerol-3-phosphate acyltransferase
MSGLRPVLDWTVTLLFLPVFGVALLVFEVVQRAAKTLGKRAHDYSVACLCTSLVTTFRITGLRIQVERSPAVARWHPYLIVANHQSMFDIALLGHLFFTNFPKFVSKRELARRIPSVSYNLRRGGNALIDRDDAEQALEAIAALGRRVERNRVSAVIFPEGTRGRGGEFRAFKPRGSLALLAAAPSTSVVPVTIESSWRLMRANFLPIPFGVRVSVRIGDPISRRPDENHAHLLEQVREEIAANLAAIRSESPVATPLRAAAR